MEAAALAQPCATSSYFGSSRPPRPGEKVGAGYFVVRRDLDTGRLIPITCPFEYPSHAAALADAVRLHDTNGGTYCVLSVDNEISGVNYDA